jgi:hypothetical protein
VASPGKESQVPKVERKGNAPQQKYFKNQPPFIRGRERISWWRKHANIGWLSRATLLGMLSSFLSFYIFLYSSSISTQLCCGSEFVISSSAWLM